MPPSYSNFFDLLQISNKQSSKIESLVTWREHFLFGTDGRVHVYQILGYDTKKPESKPRAVIAACTSAGKSAAVKQIALIPEKSLMVLLVGDSLVAHHLPPYESVCRDAVPANLFDISKDALRDPGDVGGFHIKRENGKYYLACFTTTRKVLVYEFYDTSRSFKRIGEYPIPERPRTITWVGPRIMLAFKGSYTLLTPTGAAINTAGGNGKASQVSDALPEMIMDTGRSGESCVCNLDPHGEYIIGIDTIGGRVPINGKAPSAGCKWQSVPLSVAYRDPYVLTVQSDSLEVYYPWRASHSHSLVHALNRKGLVRISQRSFIRFDDPPCPREVINDQRRDAIVLSDASNSVYLLTMLTLDQQVTELIGQSEFEIALELCDKCPLEVSDKTLKTVHFRYAMGRLFNSPDIDTLPERLKKALENFSACDADPLHVVSLFPNFLPRELAEHLRNTSSISSERTLPLERSAVVRDRCLELLQHYLEGCRSKIMANRAAREVVSEGGSSTSSVVSASRLDAERRTLTAIDTALLKTYIFLRKEDKLASSLLFNAAPAAPSSSSTSLATQQQKDLNNHFCSVDNCISFLAERGEWVALALFRRSRGLHDAALRDLRALGTRGALPEGSVGSVSLAGAPSATPNSSSSAAITSAPANLPRISPEVIGIITRRFSPSDLANTRRFLAKSTIEGRVKEDVGEMSDRARTLNINQIVAVVTSITYLRTSLDVSNVHLSDLHTAYSHWLVQDLPPWLAVTLFVGTEAPGVPAAKAAAFFDPSLVISRVFDGVTVPALPSVTASGDRVGGGGSQRAALIAHYLGAVLGPNSDGSTREVLHNMQAKTLLELIVEQRKHSEEEEIGEGGKTVDASSVSFVSKPRKGSVGSIGADGAQLSVSPEVLLLRFLETSRYYNPDTVIRWLEKPFEYSAALARQRAVIYLRQGAHQKAIAMFLHEAKDLVAAQEYATKAAARGASNAEGGEGENATAVSTGGVDAFRILLEELTRSSDADTAETRADKTRQALTVINTCDGVDALTAIPMLPDNTPLSELSSFLLAALRASHTNRRNLEVAAAITTSRLQQTQLAVLKQRKKFVTLSDNSECCKCGFKIRKDTMFAVFPNGNLAHQLCYDDESVDPSSRHDFREGIESIYLQ